MLFRCASRESERVGGCVVVFVFSFFSLKRLLELRNKAIFFVIKRLQYVGTELQTPPHHQWRLVSCCRVHWPLKANDECAKSSAACYLGTIIGPLNSLDTSNDRRVHAAFAIARQARKEAITAC